MTQKKLEERVEAIEQDVAEIKGTLQRIPAMEETLMALTKGMERMKLIIDKQEQWMEESSRTACDNQRLLTALLKGGNPGREGKGVVIRGGSDSSGETQPTEEASNWRV